MKTLLQSSGLALGECQQTACHWTLSSFAYRWAFRLLKYENEHSDPC